MRCFCCQIYIYYIYTDNAVLFSFSLDLSAPNEKASSSSLVLAVICWAHAPRGGVTRQGVVLTDLSSLGDWQQNSALFSVSVTS
jgi:hypothetical protein